METAASTADAALPLSATHIPEVDADQRLPLPRVEQRFNNADNENSSWYRRVILSMGKSKLNVSLSCASLMLVDGGGIRGYSSLLILERLMSTVEKIETGQQKRLDSVMSH